LQHAWSASPIAVSPTGTLFKGIARAPYSPLYNPSITPTAPVTPSLTPAATSSPLPCNVATALDGGYPGSVSNDTSTYGFNLLPAGSQCLAGNTAISSGSSPQQYFVWQVRRRLVCPTFCIGYWLHCAQSPATQSGTFTVDTCAAASTFSSRIFVLNQCPSSGVVTSGTIVPVQCDIADCISSLTMV
jgi:hypothetical protein